MAIEGPLRELGIHDVFQLLDLSRKTGMLRVSSELREDEGVVFFHGGRVVQAAIRSTAVATEVALLQSGRVTEADLVRARAAQSSGGGAGDLIDTLVDIGAITQKELDRQLRLQIERVVFELMSWREGFFSFEERSRVDMPADVRITVSTESLLMEGARRIDEWSRIAELVPSLTVVPELAPVQADRDGAMLDLLPHEWQVLTMIDADRDLRAIAAALACDEFEVAKIAYGLATTGVITILPARRATQEYERMVLDGGGRSPPASHERSPPSSPRRVRRSSSSSRPRPAGRRRPRRAMRSMRSPGSSACSRHTPMADDINRWSDELARNPSSLVFLQLGEALRRQGQLEVALKIALRGLERHPRNAEAHDLVARIAVDRRDFDRAYEEWETVLRIAPDHLGAMKGLGYVSFQRGHLTDAERFLRRAVDGGAGTDVGAALETLRRSSGAVLASQVVDADAIDDPQRLFADLLVDDGQTALLLDASGYVLGGLYLDADGNDLGEEIGAQLSGISDEVIRATRHLDIGEWKSILFETHAAVVAMAPGPDASLLVVAASRATPLGLLRRHLNRCLERAGQWMARGDRS